MKYYIKFTSRLDNKDFARANYIAHHDTNHLSGVNLYASKEQAELLCESFNSDLKLLSEGGQITYKVEVFSTEEGA